MLGNFKQLVCKFYVLDFWGSLKSYFNYSSRLAKFVYVRRFWKKKRYILRAHRKFLIGGNYRRLRFKIRKNSRRLRQRRFLKLRLLAVKFRRSLGGKNLNF